MTHDLAPAGSPPLGTPAGIGPLGGGDPRSASWRTRLGPLALDRPRVMGILNLTPDSFWGGSRVAGVEDALRRAASMIEAGADLLDVGGESTRPGAEAVGAREERERIVPVVEAFVREWPTVPVSVDTVKGAVARAAFDAGAAVLNDVSALRLDPAMAGIAGAAGAGVVLMHSRGSVERMASYETAVYGGDPVGEMVSELGHAVERGRAAGIPGKCMVVDPGLGFSKRTEHSLAALRELERFASLGLPVLVGPSRKRFVGELAGGLPADDRLPGTLAACVAALAAGARIFRVHDVAEARRALDVAEAVLA